MADAVVTTAVDEVDGAKLAELDGLEAFGVENGHLDLLCVEVILVPFKTHHHNQPVVAVIAAMERSFDIGNSYIGIVCLPLNIISDVLHQISRMIDQLEKLLL